MKQKRLPNTFARRCSRPNPNPNPALAKTKQTRYVHYARYYDLLYKDKDYGAETRFVHDQLAALGASRGSLLELGCGTGRHAMNFAELGYKVTGIDLSPAMVARANQRAVKMPKTVRAKPAFSVGDLVKLRLGRKFDAVVSLFHVLGYQTSNPELVASIATAATHLRPGGLFFFDFWFGPAVLTDRPSVRVKRFADEAIEVTRISEPVMDPVRNVVSIDFDVRVEDRKSQRVHRIHETHHVRYFFLPELEQILASNGFEVVAQGKWMSRERLDFQSWYGWLAARRL